MSDAFHLVPETYPMTALAVTRSPDALSGDEISVFAPSTAEANAFTADFKVVALDVTPVVEEYANAASTYPFVAPVFWSPISSHLM